MDERRFDDLARTLGANNSRRTVLKGLLAGAAGGVLGLLGGGGALAAKGGNDDGHDNGHGHGNPKKSDCCPDSAPRLCDNHCVDFQSDAHNCGGCGNACPTGSTCQNGACMCPTGTQLCVDACVDVSTDSANCGSCGSACPAGATCQGGTCVTVTGCTSDFDCPTGFHCAAGVCLANETCTPGAIQNCYSGPAGTAGVGICHAGTQTCASDGTWGPCNGEVLPQAETCNELDDDCNGVADNVDPALLASDVNNCGACGHKCVGVNSTPACVNGVCGIAACNTGFADCNDVASDGCEVNVAGDPNNCGACGTVCPSGTTCVSGICS